MAGKCKPYLAVVLWEDAFKDDDMRESQWAGKHEPLLVECIGYILRLDSDVCIVASWYMLTGTFYAGEYKDYHSIPRGMVRRITKLYA